ncbi:MAG: cytochrome c oxidase subunit II, partial [Pseudonocardiales bacterium]|nr:cytochrome c oxidase subunit II [Pseudonocardiales bacterium]
MFATSWRHADVSEVVRTRVGRAARLAGLSAVVALLTTGCSVQDVLRLGWPVGVTPQAEAMRELWIWSVLAALVVGVIVWGLILWTVVFHRKKAGDDTLPRQTQYNLPLEIIYTVIPFLIVAGLFVATVVVQNFVNVDEPRPDVTVDVVASQWNWRFDYQGKSGPSGETISTQGTAEEIPLLVLPTQRRIEFRLTAADVVHSFFVPEFLFKRDVFPRPEKNDTDNVFQIDRIDREGAFVGRCAELCGAYHSAMNFEVRALRGDLYDRYIQLRGQSNPATGVAYTASEALTALDCGQWCAPT